MLNLLVAVSSIVNCALAVLIWFKGAPKATSRVFSLFAAAVAVWAMATFCFWASSNPLFWGRIMFLGPIIMAPLFLEFALLFPGGEERFKWDQLILLSVPCSVLITLVPTEIIVKQILLPDREVVYGIGNAIFGGYFICYFVAAFYFLWKGWWRSLGKERLQFKYLFLGILLSTLVGVTTNLILPLMGTSRFNRIGPAGTVFFVGMVAYAVIRHRLMEIEIIIRKTLIFAGLLAFVLGVFSLVLFLTQDVMASYLSMQREWSLVLSVLLVVLGYEPMRILLIRSTDRFLFQKRYNYQKLLKDAARGIAQIESLHYLLGLVTHFITMRVRVKNAAVMTRDLRTGDYGLGYLRGYPAGLDENYRLPPHDELIQYLAHRKEAIEIEQIKEAAEAGKERAAKSEKDIFQHDFSEIEKQMRGLQAACCVPSFLGNELRNILILGEKKSGDYYTTEDLNVLFTLAQQSAIAIENARLYDEAVNRSRELQRINEELEVAQVKLMQALEETEKANKQLQDTQAQLIHEQKMATLGRLAASVGHEVNNPLTVLSMNVSRAILKYRKDPDLQVSEILDLFQKMEQNIGRIKAVVNTLTGLLKKSEKGKFEPLSLKLLLEETLPLVQFQTYLENPSGTEVQFDIPSDTPLIRGDLERLQEVFLNLFINAYHAMAGRSQRRVTVEARTSPKDPKLVEIDFSDNGTGMSEEVQNKAFTYGFTTKGPGRGSGMGLYICKYIIELHGGDIRVKSQPGVGTSFLLTLPIYEEPSHVGAGGGGQLYPSA